MDDQWKGEGKYKPDDGSHWTEADGKTVWIPCAENDLNGLYFAGYSGFKTFKRILRAVDKLPASKCKLKEI